MKATTIKNVSMLTIGGVACIIMTAAMLVLGWFAWDMGWFQFAARSVVVMVVVGIVSAAIIYHSERR